MSKPRRTTRHSTDQAIGPATVRHIARQLRRMSDAEVYALSVAGDRTTRRIASQVAHERAEAYALGQENT